MEAAMTVWSWLIGLFVSLVIGGLVTWQFLERLRKWMGVTKEDADPATKGVPGWLLGLLERLFFTLVIAFNVSGAAVAMMGWLTLKMAVNWNRPHAGDTDDIKRTRRIRFAMSALLTGLVAMGFALIGGLIARGEIF